MIPFGDSANYWAAGKLMLGGENPYSPEQVLELRNQAGNEYGFPPNATSMMLYPPWAIPFLMPFGLLNYPLMRLAWFIFHIVVLLISTSLIWDLYGGLGRRKIISYVILITFAPTFFVLIIGHITTLHLLGLVGFLFFLNTNHQTKWTDFAAGASASLVLIKPQLLYLFLFALLIWIIFNRRWHVFAGGIAMLIALSLIPFITNPQVFTQYWETFSNYEVGTWATPTIGMVLRLIVGLENEWLQILPVFIGLGWFLIHWRNKRENWNWIEELPLLLLICIVTTLYGWTYDMIVLLIPVIAIIIEILKIEINWIVAIYIFSYLFVNLATLYLHIFLDDFWFLWYAPFLLIWYLVGKLILRRSAKTSDNSFSDSSTSIIDN